MHRTLLFSLAFSLHGLPLLGRVKQEKSTENDSSDFRTCCIAFHAWFVIRTGIKAGSDLERQQEKRYWICLFVLQFCIFLPCGSYLRLVEASYYEQGTVWHQHNEGARRFDVLKIVFLSLQWMFIGGLCVSMYTCSGTSVHQGKRAKAAQQYR